LPIEVARKILGKDKILGYSVSNREEAVYGEKMGADYLGAGAVFTTGSKKDIGEPIGIEGLKRIKESVRIPVVAIGGVGMDNLEKVKETGVDGIAVISAILSREDTYKAAKELVVSWEK
jgi:thiamine-phosphate pyrophosphorylase